MRIEYGGAIEQGRHFEIADLHPVETRHLIMVLECGCPSCVRAGDKAGQRCQESGSEAHRICLKHVSTPRVSRMEQRNRRVEYCWFSPTFDYESRKILLCFRN